MHDVDFFLAQRDVVLVNAKHRRVGRVIQLEAEVRIAQTAGERMHASQSGARESSLYEPLHHGGGKRPGFRPNPASFLGSAEAR
jgi:hypothetical protein